MNFTRLTALLPRRTLEDVARVRTAETAEQILSAWTALWHPALVGVAGVMPHWAAAETPPEQPGGHLLLVPPEAEELLPADWLFQAEQAGAVVLRNLRRRDEMVAAALEHLEGGPPAIDPDLAADFLALGFCHLIVEIVTLQMRYMTNLDEPAFERELVAAAEAACRGDADASRAKLQAAFDLLHTAREYSYPSESHLLDLTLVAETTLGATLREALAGCMAQGATAGLSSSADSGKAEKRPPINVLISGRVLEEMARREPDSLALLRRAVEAGTAAVVGGEFHELELPLLPPEAIRYELEKGLAAYQQHLGRHPVIFGRRRFGMTPVLPEIVYRLGFTGVLHATLDDGRFPADPPGRIRWEGIDGTTVEALLRVPWDISRADTFLRLAGNLSGTTYGDHAAAAIFAHWPGRSSTWYRDIQRIARYTTVLGTFVTVTDFFERGGYLGEQRQFKADEYRSPYLLQAVESQAAGARRDPISRWVRYFSRRAMAEAIETLSALTQLVMGNPDPSSFILHPWWTTPWPLSLPTIPRSMISSARNCSGPPRVSAGRSAARWAANRRECWWPIPGAFHTGYAWNCPSWRRPRRPSSRSAGRGTRPGGRRWWSTCRRWALRGSEPAPARPSRFGHQGRGAGAFFAAGHRSRRPWPSSWSSSRLAAVVPHPSAKPLLPRPAPAPPSCATNCWRSTSIRTRGRSAACSTTSPAVPA